MLPIKMEVPSTCPWKPAGQRSITFIYWLSKMCGELKPIARPGWIPKLIFLKQQFDISGTALAKVGRFDCRSPVRNSAHVSDVSGATASIYFPLRFVYLRLVYWRVPYPAHRLLGPGIQDGEAGFKPY